MNVHEYLELQTSEQLGRMVAGWGITPGTELPGMTQQESSDFAAALRQQIMDVLHGRADKLGEEMRQLDNRAGSIREALALVTSALIGVTSFVPRITARLLTDKNAFLVFVHLDNPEQDAENVATALAHADLNVVAGYAFTITDTIAVVIPR
jgi:hypothetical protein